MLDWPEFFMKNVLSYEEYSCNFFNLMCFMQQ